MKIFVFSSLYVILFVLTVFIQLKCKGFTAGGAGNISGRKRNEFMVRLDNPFSLSGLSVSCYCEALGLFLREKRLLAVLKKLLV